MIIVANIIQKTANPKNLFRRDGREPVPRPSNTRTGTGNHSPASERTECLISAADGPTAVNTKVALPPAVVTTTGFVPSMEQIAAGLTIGETLQTSFTLLA
jgi:hypothetical protein